MGYNKPSSAPIKNDDFAERVYWLMRNRLQNENNLLTIQNINKFLDDVAKSHELNQKKHEFFIHIMRKISAIELKWLTRILLKEMRLGLTQKKVFEAIHPDAEELFNVTSNLQRVCERFANSGSEESEKIVVIQIEIFSHVKPMLLERLKIEQSGKLFTNNQQYYVQTKFDGERAQMHVKDGKFKYFSRQGFDITNNNSYGETAVSGGFLTSKISLLLSKDVRSIILDGELMGWHKYRKCFGSKGYAYDVKKLTEKSYYQPCFVAYDILLYNDELMVNKTYSERLSCLKSAFIEEDGVLMISKTDKVSSVKQLVDLFNVALDNNEEGIVLKSNDALYKPNVREKSGCYKIKAEYSDGLVQDLDLIVLGGYYGEGRWSGMVNSFLVGVASPPINKSGLPSEFFPVVKVASGLKDADLKMIQEKFKPHWKNQKPTGVFPLKPTECPNVWIPPKHSIILQLRATEIIRTRVYPLGYSMRFPRVLKIRDDKPWFNACNTSEFMTLIKTRGIVQKLTKRKVASDEIDDEEDEDNSKIRKTTSPSKKIYDCFLPIKNDEIIRVSRLFEGKKFCVINGDAKLDKNKITTILQKHMAKIIQNPGPDTFCVLVGRPETLRAKNIISSEKYDVAKLSWLTRVTKPENYSKIQDFYPWELYSMRPSTQQRLESIYDPYFDSYVEDLDEERLSLLIEIDEMLREDLEVPVSEMKKLDKLIFDDHNCSPFSIFREITGYFHNKDSVEKYSFMFMNGKVAEEMSEDIDYVFVDDDISEVSLQQFKRKMESKFSRGERLIPILRIKWIADSFISQKMFPIEHYIL